MQQRPEASEVLPGAGEALEETRERRLARHPFDPEQCGHHRIAAQVSEVGEFLRAAQQALDKTEHLRQRTQRVVGGRLRVRQATRDQFPPATLRQERPERRGARVRAELLIGELDLDRLARAFERDLFGHRLVKRASALRLVFFHSITSHFPNGGAFSNASLRLRRVDHQLRLPDRPNVGRLLFGFELSIPRGSDARFGRQRFASITSNHALVIICSLYWDSGSGEFVDL